jgi:hypothetical protein
MKDKRQKLAFAWPGYPGDPFSYFSYMYAAAASGYAPPPLAQSGANPVIHSINPLAAAAAAAARLATSKVRSVPTSQILNGSTDTTTSYSSASSPTSSSSSPKQTLQQHSPIKPTINFALPAMGLASFMPNAVNESSTTST